MKIKNNPRRADCRTCNSHRSYNKTEPEGRHVEMYWVFEEGKMCKGREGMFRANVHIHLNKNGILHRYTCRNQGERVKRPKKTVLLLLFSL